MEPKVGVYFCTGCQIGESLDMEALEKVATDEYNIPVCKSHHFLCSPEGVKLIKDDIEKESVNKVVVCACSPRMFAATFNFNSGTITERVDLRERVVWTHEPNDEDTQMLAEDYVRMGIAKINAMSVPEPFVDIQTKVILVVGGGVAGMTSTLAAANAGYEVVLVEKEAELGGWARKFSKVFPKRGAYDNLEEPPHQDLIEKVNNHEKIKVYLNTEIEKTSGQPGQFEVTLKGGSSETIKVASIVQATGWKPYDPSNLGKWGYGSSPNVITNIQMEEMTKAGEIKCPGNGKEPETVVFIQCAGSRDKDYLPYCSGVCCRVSLKQALYVREKYPNARIYIIYKDIRTPAQFELFYKKVQEDDGIFFAKAEIEEVTGKNGKVSVKATDSILGENVEIEADLVVLATGMVPTTKVEEGAEKEEALEDGKKAAESAEVGAHILNLTYRQGTDLPTLKYGFPDSHYICFPYETRRTAIYAAGAVRAPMDFGTAMSDAYGAALKAINAVESLSKGVAVHPRSGDLTFPDFFLQRCTQCKRCTEECPFGALDEDEKGTPKPNPNRCRRCGICMGACPERIISFANYSPHIISEAIKAINVPDEFEEKPRILAFVCENDALPALDMAALERIKYNAWVRFIPVRCLGSVNTVWISDALSRGIDGILELGCRYGDDYQCHFIHGSELANRRMENVQDKLQQLVLEPERVQIREVLINDWKKLPQVIDEFVEEITEMDPNPYKGF